MAGKGKGKRPIQGDNSDESSQPESDPEDVPRESQKRQRAAAADASQPVEAALPVTDDEVRRLVGNMVRYALFKDSSKEAIVDTGITELVLGEDYRRKRNVKSSVIKAANEYMKHVFGFSLKPLMSSVAPREKTQAVGSIRYVVQNNLPANVAKQLDWKVEGATRGFLTTILCLVFLGSDGDVAERVLPEEDLWDHLATLGIKRKEKDHPELGNIEDTVKMFVKHMYLAHSKEAGYKIGPRSITEITLSHLYTYIHVLCDQPPDAIATKQIEEWRKVEGDASATL